MLCDNGPVCLDWPIIKKVKIQLKKLNFERMYLRMVRTVKVMANDMADAILHKMLVISNARDSPCIWIISKPQCTLKNLMQPIPYNRENPSVWRIPSDDCTCKGCAFDWLIWVSSLGHPKSKTFDQCRYCWNNIYRVKTGQGIMLSVYSGYLDS